MKKTLLALACAAMATASLHAESVEIVRTDWQYPANNMNTARTLNSGTAKDAGFNARFYGNVDTSANTYYLWNNSGAYVRYLCLTGNTNEYIIESIDIEFGALTNPYEVNIQVRTSDTAYASLGTDATTHGEEILTLPYIPGETINVPIDNKFFSLVDLSTASENENIGNKVEISKLTINYSAGAPKEDPSWTLVNPGNEMTPGSSFMPAVENNTENLEIKYTLKFGTMPIPANADGSFNVPYSNSTYTLTATSAPTDSYNAKEQSVQFTVAAQEAKWVIVEPTGLVKGDKYTPTFSVTPDTDTEVTFTLSWEKVTETESEDGEGNVTTTTSTSWIEVDRNADGSYNLENAGRYKLVAESEASAKYNKRTQTVYFTVENATGVETIDADAEVTYYTLQGVAVKDATPGLYIMKQGKTVRKVIIK